MAKRLRLPQNYPIKPGEVIPLVRVFEFSDAVRIQSDESNRSPGASVQTGSGLDRVSFARNASQPHLRGSGKRDLAREDARAPRRLFHRNVYRAERNPTLAV